MTSLALARGRAILPLRADPPVMRIDSERDAEAQTFVAHAFAMSGSPTPIRELFSAAQGLLSNAPIVVLENVALPRSQVSQNPKLLRRVGAQRMHVDFASVGAPKYIPLWCALLLPRGETRQAPTLFAWKQTFIHRSTEEYLALIQRGVLDKFIDSPTPASSRRPMLAQIRTALRSGENLTAYRFAFEALKPLLADSTLRPFQFESAAEARVFSSAYWEVAQSLRDLYYVHRWSSGSLVLWNNSSLLHARGPGAVEGACFRVKAPRDLTLDSSGANLQPLGPDASLASGAGTGSEAAQFAWYDRRLPNLAVPSTYSAEESVHGNMPHQAV